MKLKHFSKELIAQMKEAFKELPDAPMTPKVIAFDSNQPFDFSMYTKDDHGDGIVWEDIFDYLELRCTQLFNETTAYPCEESYDRLMKIIYIADKAEALEGIASNLSEEHKVMYWLSRSKRDLRDIKLIAPEHNELLEYFE